MKSRMFGMGGVFFHLRGALAVVFLTLAMSVLNLAHAIFSPSTTVLTVEPSPAYVGQSVTLRASVTGNTPNGLVTFFHGILPIGTAFLSNGSASITTQFGSAGNHALKAVYAGDLGSLPSTSGFVTLTVKNKIASVTTLSSSANPAYQGQAITLTVAVTGSNPTGTVTFKSGASSTLGTAPVVNGQAQLQTSFPNAGTFNLSATYGGDAAHNADASNALTLNVQAKAPSSASLQVSPNPAYEGQSVTLVAAVSGNAPGGTVVFKDGSATLGSAALSGGQASLTTVFQSPGAHALSVSYAGDGANMASTSSPLALTVQARADTTVTLAAAPDTSVLNEPVTLTATVAGSAPTGSVTFKADGNVIGSAPISGGVAVLVTSFASAGSHSLSASYGGDGANKAGVSQPMAHTVDKRATSSTLSSSANPIMLGETVTLTVAVSGGQPTGAVTLLQGGVAVASAQLDNGVAIFTRSFDEVRSHVFTAVYAGDASHAASTSAPLEQAIDPRATSTTLAVSADTVAVRGVLTLTASVTGFQPTGTVTFTDGGTTLGTAVLTNGQATFSLSFDVAGLHQFKAAYGGNVSNSFSESASMPVAVVASASTVTLAASASSASVGQNVTLSVTVTGNAPTGTVTFLDGDTTLGTAALVEGAASFNASFDTPGTHTLMASYGGDAANEPGTSLAFALDVQGQTGGAGPGAMTWLYGYDAMGNRTSVTDPNGHLTTTSYDPLSRPFTISMQPPQQGGAAAMTSLRHDALDQLIKVIDPRLLETNYAVDGLGNQTALSSPDTGSSSSTYDAAGRLVSRTDARGKTAVYTYDALNRVTRISYGEGTATVFEYDGGANPVATANGQLTRMGDESGWTTFTYDAFGNMLSKEQNVVTANGTRTLRVGYEWGSIGSANGKLTAITYPSGLRVNYGYDATGRPSSVSVDPVGASGDGHGANLPVLQDMRYSGANDLLGWTWGNGNAYNRSYDAFGRLLAFPLGDPLGTGSAAGVIRTVVYDDAGRITGYAHADGSGPRGHFDQQFTYDGQDRLKSMNMLGTSYGYSYDANGNRTARRIGGSNFVNTVDPSSNRLTSIQMPSGNGALTATQVYDAAGNLLDNGSSTVSVYSARGRLSQVTVAAGSVDYLYNGREQRVVKTGPVALVASGAAYYAYDEEGRLIGEYDADLVPVYETVYASALPVAVVKQDRVGQAVQTTLAHIYADQLGAPRLIARGSDSAVVWRWDHAEAFGATPPDQNPNGLGVFVFNQRFPGQVFDGETGTFYNWHRTYQASSGRYLQSDPKGLVDGFGTYGYVEGNPLSSKDPMGLSLEDVRYVMGLVIRSFADVKPSGGVNIDANVRSTANADTDKLSGQINVPASYGEKRCLSKPEFINLFYSLFHEAMHSTDPWYIRLMTTNNSSDRHHQSIHNRTSYEKMRPRAVPTLIWGTPNSKAVDDNAIYAEYVRNSPDCKRCRGN